MKHKNWLVALICLVCLVYLLEPDEPDQPEKPEKPDEPDKPKRRSPFRIPVAESIHTPLYSGLSGLFG